MFDDDFEKMWDIAEKTIKQFNPTIDFESMMKLKSMSKKLAQEVENKQNQPISPLCDIYFFSARADLVATTVLMTIKEFGLSVYHVQQAIEKITKGFFLFLGQVTPEELDHHRTPQYVLQTIVNKPQKGFAAILDQTGDGQFKQNFAAVQRVINSDKNAQETFAKMPYQSDSELSISTLLKLSNLGNEDKLKLTVKEALESFCSQLPNTQSSSYDWLLPAQVANLAYLLGALTFVHESTTRFPGSFLEPQDYVPTLGIVQALPELVDKAHEMLDKAKEFISFCGRKQPTS